MQRLPCKLTLGGVAHSAASIHKTINHSACFASKGCIASPTGNVQGVERCRHVPKPQTTKTMPQCVPHNTCANSTRGSGAIFIFFQIINHHHRHHHYDHQAQEHDFRRQCCFADMYRSPNLQKQCLNALLTIPVQTLLMGQVRSSFFQIRNHHHRHHHYDHQAQEHDIRRHGCFADMYRSPKLQKQCLSALLTRTAT